jgi:DNA-directed RNA polymerase specialized sigma24 family protein
LQRCVWQWGDTAAEAELARLWNWMTDLGRRWVRCAHFAEDVAGEAVERAWMQFGDALRWDLHRKWVARSARNLLVNARKRERKSGQDVETCEDPRTCSWLATHGASELISGVEASISPEDRATLLLMEMGESTAEIAASRGVTVRAVQQSMVRIRCAFAAALDEE